MPPLDADGAPEPRTISFVAVRHEEGAAHRFRPIREVAVVRVHGGEWHLEQVCVVTFGSTPTVFTTHRDGDDGSIAAEGPHPRSRREAVEHLLAATRGSLLAGWNAPRVLEDLECLQFDEGLRWPDGMPQLLDMRAAVWATLGRLPASRRALAAELGLDAPVSTALSQAWWLSRVGQRLRESQELAARVARFAGDETSIARRVIDRLDQGRKQYGAWPIGGDGRDYRTETIEELVDTAHYLAAEVERLDRELAATKRRRRRPIALCLHRDPRLLDHVAAQVLTEGSMPVLAQRVLDQFVKDGVSTPRAVRALVDACDEVRVYGGPMVPDLHQVVTLAIACGKRVRYIEEARS